VRLDVADTGEGAPPVVLMHGLTGTKRYVVMGSKVLERGGHRVVAFDARGHGGSDPAESYDYEALAADLERVLDEAGIPAAVLAGASMGAHTAVRFALDHPDRVLGLCLITPAFAPGDERELHRWDGLAEALRDGGVEGFLAAYGEPDVPGHFRDKAIEVLRQRLSAHDHLDAVADALEQVPRSHPFERWSDLSDVHAPTVVVASRDEFDAGHPYEVGQRYAGLIPEARMVSEDPGASPLAWQGGQLSKVIAEVAAQAPP
jgi:pimeloyl-ACP methyl ester carboxylesterase